MSLAAHGATATLISEGRYHVVLPPELSSSEAVALVRAAGGELVSINPVRDTLEDFFLAQVQHSARRAFD